MDYFPDVLDTVLDLGTFQVCLSMEGQRALGFHQKLNLCSEGLVNKGLTGLERHEGE